MDLTTATLDELKARIAEIGPGDEFNMISNRIAELELEEKAKAVEQETVTNEVAKFMDSLSFEGVEPKELFLNYTEEKAIASYDYVNAVIQNAVSKMKQAELANTNTLTAEINTLQAKCDKLQQEKEELSHDLSVQNLEVSDLNARLANATRLLDEEKAEVERLTSQVDDLRKEIAIGAAAATKVEDVDLRSAHEKWLEQRQKEEDAKPVIYNIRWDETTKIQHTHYLAELAETDETILIPYVSMSGDIEKPTEMKGKYRVVTSEQAPSFRTAAAANEENHADVIPVGSEVSDYIAPSVNPDSFRDTEENTPESAESGLATETSTVAGQVSAEEFEKLKAEFYDVKSRVTALESIRAVA